MGYDCIASGRQATILSSIASTEHTYTHDIKYNFKYKRASSLSTPFCTYINCMKRMVFPFNPNPTKYFGGGTVDGDNDDDDDDDDDEDDVDDDVEKYGLWGKGK